MRDDRLPLLLGPYGDYSVASGPTNHLCWYQSHSNTSVASYKCSATTIEHQYYSQVIGVVTDQGSVGDGNEESSVVNLKCA